MSMSVTGKVREKVREGFHLGFEGRGAQVGGGREEATQMWGHDPGLEDQGREPELCNQSHLTP